jgi:hypothetical protein
MSKDEYQELITQLEDIKYRSFEVWGQNFNLKDPFLKLKFEIKDFFPLNEVPYGMVQQLKVLEKSIEKSLEEMDVLINKFIFEVKKHRKKIYPDCQDE